MTKTFRFASNMWRYQGKAAWHFITVPKEITKDIDQMFAHAKRGWGSLPVIVTIGATTWTTSIFPDKKAETFLLPVKAQVRKEEKLSDQDSIRIDLEISD